MDLYLLLFSPKSKTMSLFNIIQRWLHVSWTPGLLLNFKKESSARECFSYTFIATVVKIDFKNQFN